MLKVWLADFYLAVDRLFRRLVAAAGAGREMIALAGAGFEVDGFDCDPTFVTTGRRALAERGIEGRFEWAAPCRIPSITRTYGAAIIGWNGYTHITPRERRVAFLRSLSPHLCAGAPVLVSVFVNTSQGRVSVLMSRIANTVRRVTLRSPVVDAGAAFPGRPKHYFRKRPLEADLAAAVCRLLSPVPVESPAPIRKAQ